MTSDKTIDEHFDGEVHGLLATAFDGDLPAVNLVPGAVAGYRRHRRRTRVLGTAGGALAVAGVVAGATVPSWGGASSVQAAAGGGAGQAAVAASPAPAPVTPACHATAFYKFGDSVGIEWYLGDLKTLQAVCDRDVAALKAMIPGSTVTPRTETARTAEQVHDTTAGMPLPKVPADAPIVDTGSYTVEVGGHTVFANLDFSTKQLDWGSDCAAGKCPPNLTLADGTPARSFVAPQPLNDFVAVFSDSSHVANVRVGDNSKNAAPLPFDFTAMIRSDQFARLIHADTAQLTRLTHN